VWVHGPCRNPECEEFPSRESAETARPRRTGEPGHAEPALVHKDAAGPDTGDR